MKQILLKPLLSRLKNWLDNYELMFSPSKDVPFDNDGAWVNSHYLRCLSNPELWRKPQYVWGALKAAALGKALKYNSISFIEFGVAAGSGLKVLDKIAQEIEQLIDIKIEVHGFDTGKGMPKPKDYRDLPNLFKAGDYNMDFNKLSFI